MDFLKSDSATQILALFTTYGFRVVGVLLVLGAAWLISSFARKATYKALMKIKFDETLSKFFSNVARYAILIFAALGCLGVFGIETTSFAAVLAAGGLAVGLAFQGSLSNLAAGIMLLIFRPFKVNDLITVSNVTGFVEEIELFSTTLKTLAGQKVIIPNSGVFGNTIENFTYFPTRRTSINVGVEYRANIDETRKVLEKALQNIPGALLEPAPQVFLSGLGASSVDWQLRVWAKTEEYWDVYQATIRAAKMALDEAGIGIPFPQMDVHFDTRITESLQMRFGVKDAHA